MSLLLHPHQGDGHDDKGERQQGEEGSESDHSQSAPHSRSPLLTGCRGARIIGGDGGLDRLLDLLSASNRSRHREPFTNQGEPGVGAEPGLEVVRAHGPNAPTVVGRGADRDVADAGRNPLLDCDDAAFLAYSHRGELPACNRWTVATTCRRGAGHTHVDVSPWGGGGTQISPA